MEITNICVQEIALEGLEGITLPTLWLRLENHRPKLPYAISHKLQEFLWKFILQYEPLQILRLPEARGEPEIFDRFKDVIGDTPPIASNPDELDTMVEVYSLAAVKSKEVRGCCSNYHLRKNIKADIIDMSLDMNTCMEKYGRQKIVVVAPQALREQHMLHGNLNGVILKDLSEYSYCILENIARSRWQGVIMSRLRKMEFPNISYQAAVMILYNLGLVTKTYHAYRMSENSRSSVSQILVYLKKFECDDKRPSARLMKRFMDELRNAPGQTMTLGDLKAKMDGKDKIFKRIYWTLNKSGDIMIDDLNSPGHCKSIHNMVASICDKSLNIDGDADEDSNLATLLDENVAGLRPLYLNQPYLNQAYDFVKDHGPRGISRNKMKLFLGGFRRLEARSVMKRLLERKLVNMTTITKGKHRIQMFSSKIFCPSHSELEKDCAVELPAITSSASLEGAICTLPDSSCVKEHELMRVTFAMKWKDWRKLILERLALKKIIIGCVTVQKMISGDIENGNLIKKSIVRNVAIDLLKILEKSGDLRICKIPVSYLQCVENVHFVMSTDCSEAHLKSAVALARFDLAWQEEVRIAKLNQYEDHQQSLMEEPDRNLSRRILQPKFIRLGNIHQFIWYLTYGHSYCADNELFDSLTPKQYGAELPWQRHLPPAPIYMYKGKGWLRVLDLVLVMPVSLLCQILSVPREFDSILLDEDKCHMPNFCLPSGLKYLVFHEKQYKDALIECLEQLCFMGLLTLTWDYTVSHIENGRSMSKECMILHVHRNASIVDTRLIEDRHEKDAPSLCEKVRFALENLQDLDTFWSELKTICLQSNPVIHRPKSQEKRYDSKNSFKKMRQFVQAAASGELHDIDHGSIPGDGLGAGGLDSSLLSHYYRNWSYHSPAILSDNEKNIKERKILNFNRGIKRSNSTDQSQSHTFLSKKTKSLAIDSHTINPNNRDTTVQDAGVYFSSFKQPRFTEKSCNQFGEDEMLVKNHVIDQPLFVSLKSDTTPSSFSAVNRRKRRKAIPHKIVRTSNTDVCEKFS